MILSYQRSENAKIFCQWILSVYRVDYCMSALIATGIGDIRAAHLLLFVTGADTPYYLAQLPPKTEVRGAHVAKREVVSWQ